MKARITCWVIGIFLAGALAFTLGGLRGTFLLEVRGGSAKEALNVLANAEFLTSEKDDQKHDDTKHDDHGHHSAHNHAHDGHNGNASDVVPEWILAHQHGPGCHHDCDAEHAHYHGSESSEGISHGMILIMQNLGLQELAANLLWIQMDADSHRQLWHRVELALKLIPAIDPNFSEAYLLHAYLLDIHLKQHEQAVMVLEEGVRNNPLRDELWIQLGVMHLNFRKRHGPARDLPKALEAFSKACSISTSPGYAFRLRAITLTCMDRREEAINWLQAITQLPDRDPIDRENDAALLQRLKSGDTWD